MFSSVIASISIAVAVCCIMRGWQYAAPMWVFNAAMFTFIALGDLK